MSHPFVPAGSGAPAPHPTVPFGQPGGPGTVVLPPNAPVPSASVASQLTAPPAPVGFSPQAPAAPAAPAAPPAPSTFPQGTQPPYAVAPQAQPAAQPQGQVTIPDNFVLDGPTVPQELRGRTWAQVKAVYGALASEFISGRPSAVPAPRPNQPTAPAPQPQAQSAAAPAGQPDRVRSFWEDPMAAIDQAIERRLAPVTQRTSAMAVQDAMNLAKSHIQDYAQLEAEMIPVLRAAPPELQQDPSFWTSTADLVRGRLMAAGRYQYQGAPAARPPQAPQPQSAPPGPGAFVPTFFTEAPTPPAPNGFNGGAPNQYELSSEQKMYASKMGMSEQEYRDWSGGIQRTVTSTRRF